MSYAENVLRRRQEMERAFRERYNPMEDVVSALSEIDKEAFRREQIAAEEKRSVEKYGLEKERILAETKKLNQDRSASEASLANQREGWAEAARQRAAEFQARAAEERRKTKQGEEERAAQVAAEQVFGKMQREGLTSKDIFTTKTMGEDLAGVVAAHGGETPAMKVGTTMKDIEEIADASGVPADVLMSMVQVIESERTKMGADLGLIEAKTEKEKAAAEAARRRGLPKPAKAVDTEVEDAKRRKILAEAARAEAKRLRDEQISKAGGFFLSKEQADKLKDARLMAAQRAQDVIHIRNLIKANPDIEKYVGKFDQYISSVRASLGDAKAAQIQKAFGTAFDNYRVHTTGLAAGESELKRLQKNVPNMGDSLEQILGKLADDDAYIAEKFRIIDPILQSGDLRAADDILGVSDTKEKPPAATPAAAPKKKKLPESVQSEIDKFGLED